MATELSDWAVVEVPRAMLFSPSAEVLWVVVVPLESVVGLSAVPMAMLRSPVAYTLLPMARVFLLVALALGPMAMASAILAVAPVFSSLAVRFSLELLMEKYFVLALEIWDFTSAILLSMAVVE